MSSKYFATEDALLFCVGTAIENAETTSRGRTLSRPSEVSMSRSDFQRLSTYRHQGSRDEHLHEATPMRCVRDENTVLQFHPGRGHRMVRNMPLPFGPRSTNRLPPSMRAVPR